MVRSYKTRDAAKYIGSSKSWLDKAAAEGTGPAYRMIGRIRIYDEPDLDAYKRATRVEPTQQQQDRETAETEAA